MYGIFRKPPESQQATQELSPLQSRVEAAISQYKQHIPAHLGIVLNPILSQLSGKLSDELIVTFIQKGRQFLDHIEYGVEQPTFGDDHDDNQG